jgi:two-component system sensor histidine kinase RegB
MEFLPIPSADAPVRKNLHWLFVLRNFVLGGVVLVLMLSVWGLNIHLQTAPLWGVLSFYYAANWLTKIRMDADIPVTEFELMLQLGIDILAMTAMLYFTGGATNPIAWFFLLPLIIAATILPQSYTWYLVIFSSACYTALLGYYKPLPNLHPEVIVQGTPYEMLAAMQHRHLELHTFGMWFGFVFSAGVVAYFVVEMASTLREQERRLAETRESFLRNERVVALGTLAAGAAHEMGTPLGTMAIILKDLERDYSGGAFADLRGKARILRAQVDRCKEALSVMSASAGELRAESGRKMAVDHYLDEVIAQWRGQRPDTPLQYRAEGFQPPPPILAERTLTHALVNIINNAADVSPEFIAFDARWDRQQAVIEIRDRGPGIRPEVFARIGKTPLTTKSQGLGVGLFLAHATVERLGGTIEMSTQTGGGTLTRICVPLLANTLKPEALHGHA